LKKFATLGVSFAAVMLSVTAFAAPASARAHRHHRHHHHGGGGGGIVCGAGTVLVNGTCVPTGPTGPVGNANVNFNPSSVTMNLDGTFSASVIVSGLPPAIGIGAVTPPPTCGPAGTFGVALTSGVDALGRLQALVFRAGAPGCVPGTYPVTFTEATSPFATFTGFITLHF